MSETCEQSQFDAFRPEGVKERSVEEPSVRRGSASPRPSLRGAVPSSAIQTPSTFGCSPRFEPLPDAALTSANHSPLRLQSSMSLRGSSFPRAPRHSPFREMSNADQRAASPVPRQGERRSPSPSFARAPRWAVSAVMPKAGVMFFTTGENLAGPSPCDRDALSATARRSPSATFSSVGRFGVESHTSTNTATDAAVCSRSSTPTTPRKSSWALSPARPQLYATASSPGPGSYNPSTARSGGCRFATAVREVSQPVTRDIANSDASSELHCTSMSSTLVRSTSNAFLKAAQHVHESRASTRPQLRRSSRDR